MTLHFEDLSAGDELEPRTIDAPRGEDMRLIAALLQDPYPAHYDEEWCEDRGYPGLLNQGPANLSYLLQTVFDALASPADLRSFDTRYEDMVFEGQSVTAMAIVETTYLDDGEGVAEFAVELRKEGGQVAVRGTIVARFPRAEA